MAIEIDGKVYRNLQEQVAKNMDDIQTLKEGPYADVTKVYVDEQDTATLNAAKSYADAVAGTKCGYIELSEEPVTLTDAQYAEVQKDYCVIKYNNKLYYKFGSSALGIHFKNFDFTNSTSSSGTSVQYRVITVDDSKYATMDYEQVVKVFTASNTYSKTQADDKFSKKLYKHDILLSLVDSQMAYAGVHMIIIDEYASAYDYSKVRADWRGDIRAISYHRKQGSSELSNENTKVWPSFYLDNDDELWFEENETFYSGSAVVTETVNSYQVMAIDDTVLPL